MKYENYTEQAPKEKSGNSPKGKPENKPEGRPENRTAKRKRTTFRLVLNALFVALYVVLSSILTVKTPVTEVSLSTLPILLSGYLSGPLDALLVATVGSFIEQMLYGLSPTAILWMLPPMLTGLLAGLFGFVWRGIPHKGRRSVIYLVATTFTTELFCTIFNTGVLYLDGYIVGYAVKALHLLLPVRLANLGLRSVVTCILMPILLPIVTKMLAKKESE